MVMDKLPSDATDFSEASISNESSVKQPQNKVLAYDGYVSSSADKMLSAKTKKFGFNWSALSLRTKATVLAIALGVVPTVGIASLAYYLDSKALAQKVAENHQSQANEAIEKLTRFVFERYGDVQVLANFPIFRNQALSATISLQDKQKVLAQFAETYQIYDSIAVYGLDGKLIVNGGAEKAPANNADRDYFQMAIKTGKPFISQPTISKVTKVANVFFAAPIKDSVTGQTIAVVRTRMPVKDLEKVIQNYGDAKNQINYHFFDGSGKIFMATEKKQVDHDVNADFPDGFTAIRTTGKSGSWIGHDQNQKTVETLNAFTPTQAFQGMPDLKWGIVYTIESQNAFKSVDELRNSLFLGTAVAALLVGLIGAYLAERAIRPIKAAADAV